MKKGLIALVTLASVIGWPLMAAEEGEGIDSGVIHHYKFLGVGYGYIHDVLGDADGHGVVGMLSFEDQNFVLDAGSGLLPTGYFWVDEDAADINLWNVTARFGYVLRLMNNHINIIPRIGGSLTGIEIEDFSDDTWSITPGVGLSYAINNRLAINGGYTWNHNFDDDDGSTVTLNENYHIFNGGATVALFEHLGLSLNAFFIEDVGFAGATATVEFHF